MVYSLIYLISFDTSTISVSILVSLDKCLSESYLLIRLIFISVKAIISSSVISFFKLSVKGIRDFLIIDKTESHVSQSSIFL